MEFETTVSLVFGGELFQKIYERLNRRHHLEEDLDIYTFNRLPSHTSHSESRRFKYREMKRYVPLVGGGKNVVVMRDRKLIKRCMEQQVPHIDPVSGRVLFVSTTYKSSVEGQVTEEQWTRTVREDHSTASCLRTANKHRLSFPPQSFSDLFNGHVPGFTRLSIGEYSQYGGTLEARTKCNPIYYLEIEKEYKTALKGPDEIRREAERLVEILFTVLPYRLISETMRKEAAATVQRERTDNVFDEFKRRFVDYNRCRIQLWNATTETRPSKRTDSPGITFFLMPKWDGMKATASYCDGYLFVRDTCGSLSTFSVQLPFDNDVILQLEIVKEDGSDKKLLVVTEILAVVVKSHDTLYHVYNRSNTLDDTGRFAGNVDTSITLKTQFKNPDNRCNTYRLVSPLYSLLTLHSLGEYRARQLHDSRRGEEAATNTYMRDETPRVILTTVAIVDSADGISNLLNTLDEFHNYKAGVKQTPSTVQEEMWNKSVHLRTLSQHLPPWLLGQAYFRNHCEGLLTVFVVKAGVEFNPTERARPTAADTRPLPNYGYMKIKIRDTVDLEYHLSTGLANSASGKYRFRVQGVPEKFAGWAERPRPVTNGRAIIECYFDRDLGAVVYVKDRPDKNKADNEEKIAAIDNDIIPTCAISDI